MSKILTPVMKQFTEAKKNHPNSIFYGFDSFEGLQEDWRKSHKKGIFKVDFNSLKFPKLICDVFCKLDISELKNSLDLKTLCNSHNALFIVNDYADIANLSHANGLHIGQKDLSVESSRLITSDAQIIGKSNNTIDEAISSQSEAPDYLAIGPIYSTSTMGKDLKQPVGTETIKEVKSRGIPVLVAIGGINIDNADIVSNAGADSICVASAVTLAENPEIATSKLVDILKSKG